VTAATPLSDGAPPAPWSSGSSSPPLVAFGFVTIAAYAGTLRALDVYFDPEQDSVFLSDDRPPRMR
jgi:hypothetical protein